MPLAFFASAPGRLVSIGIVIALLIGVLYTQVRANGRIAADRDNVLAVNRENAKLIAAQMAAAKRADEVAAREAAKAAAADKTAAPPAAEADPATPES